MTATHVLAEPPKVELETVRVARAGEGGFLALLRTELVAIHDGTRSAEFAYDVVDRHALDAAVIVAHHREGGRVYVWLRSSVRPPLALRGAPPSSQGRDRTRPVAAVLWEVPAGLIEPGESPRAGAVREIAEELGFDVLENALVDLGPPAYPAPGLIAEVQHFFHVEVDPTTRREALGDGSPVEASSCIIHVTLEEALAACRAGGIPDGKTELAFRRLAEAVA